MVSLQLEIKQITGAFVFLHLRSVFLHLRSVFLHLRSVFLHSRLALSIVSLYQGTAGLVTVVRFFSVVCQSSSADKVIVYLAVYASKASATSS